MGLPVITLWLVQSANVAQEEARQVLNEIDFTKVSDGSSSCNMYPNVQLVMEFIASVTVQK